MSRLRRLSHERGRPFLNRSFRSLLAALLVCVVAGAVAEPQSDDRVVPIAHPDVSSDALAQNTVRAMFAMRLRAWPGGDALRVFVLADDHALHTAFAKQVLDVYPHQLRLAWDRLVFSGTGQAPIRVDTEQEMYERVVQTPGAIGYAYRSRVDDRVQILDIE